MNINIFLLFNATPSVKYIIPVNYPILKEDYNLSMLTKIILLLLLSTLSISADWNKLNTLMQ